MKDRDSHSDRDPDEDGVPGRDWTAVVLELAPGQVDEALARFASDSIGVDLDGGATSSRVRIWFERDAEAREVFEAVQRWRAADAGGPSGSVLAKLERLADGRWAERYQAGLAPFPLGARFLVDPTGAERDVPEQGGRIPIRLAPGGAFGTGQHTTTRLCVGLLETLVEPGSRWLDLGCGSGILAVVAHRLGATLVGAVDIDPEAVAVARRVIARNGADRVVSLWNGSLSEVTLDRWDGVVANIDLSFFVDHALQLARIPRPGGCLVASGFLAQDARVVALRATHAGLVPTRTEVAPPWAAMVARRGGP